MMTILFIISLLVIVALTIYIQMLKTDKDYYKGCHDIHTTYEKECKESSERMANLAIEAHEIASGYLNGLRYADHFLPPRKRAEMWKIASPKKKEE